MDLKEQESEQSASARLSLTKAQSSDDTGPTSRTSETSSHSGIVSFPSRYSMQPTKFNDVADTLTLAAGAPAVLIGGTQTSSPEDSHARTSALQDHARDSEAIDQSSHSPSLTLWKGTIQSSWCWKTSQDYSLPLRGVTSEGSSVKWRNSGMASRGAFWTRNTSESHNAGEESSLSQVLETTAAEKYYLSAKAAAGILRRAHKRKKVLPPELVESLINRATGLDHGTALRRLTPTECERLMGWPDGWTIGEDRWGRSPHQSEDSE